MSIFSLPALYNTAMEMELTNFSLKSRPNSEIFGGVNLGPRDFRYMRKKYRVQKSHATVPFNGVKGTTFLYVKSFFF